MNCYGCGQPIEGPIIWLSEDHRAEGGEIAGPFPMHQTCADAPWPLYEVTEEEAVHLLSLKVSH